MIPFFKEQTGLRRLAYAAIGDGYDFIALQVLYVSTMVNYFLKVPKLSGG